jgi:predicted adenine nucleotide alpha hydrolase (AANH) superfamily ATPase
MSPKTKTKRSATRKRDLEVDQQAIKILRNVSDAEAFYFYENIGKPTGENAKNLSDFLKTVNTVKLESLQFHVERKDFQKWFKETLGDSELAERIERIAATDDEKLRTKIHEILEHRLQELKSACMTFEVKTEELTVKN